MFTSLLDAIEIADKDISCDALLTQRNLASYLISRKAHYHFTVKGNQPTLQRDIARAFKSRGEADYAETTAAEHGRIETRRIWTTDKLNAYLDFPHVGQVYLIEREVRHKKSGKTSLETALCVSSRKKEEAKAKRLLEINRKHWCIENRCHYVIDWNFDEDRSRIRTGYGPENTTRLRRFAITVITQIKDKKKSVAEQMRRLGRNTRLVFDYLRMTKNSVRQL